MTMPLRINELTSNVRVTEGTGALSERDLARIVSIVMQRIREEQEHQRRVSDESTIRNQASEIEPY
jgi:hypothetical protein